MQPASSARPAAEVAKAFEALARSIKRISNYRHARDKFGEYLQPAHAELSAIVARHGNLTVSVEPTAFVYDGEAVLNEPAREVSLCFRLHRDGIRKLTFKSGLAFDDLLAFARIALPDALEGAEIGREDASLELWKADLQTLDYEAVPIYEVVRTEADRAQLQEIAARAQKALRAQGLTVAVEEEALAALEPLVLPAERDALDPLAGVQRLRRAALLLVRIVERRLAGRDLDSLTEALGRLFDEMLRQEDGQALGATLERLAQPATAELAHRLAPRLGEAWRLARLAAICLTNVDLLIFGLPVYLSLLPPDVGPALVEVLPGIEGRSVREAFASSAAARIRSSRRQYEEALRSGPAEVARALLGALHSVPQADRGALSSIALEHADPSVQTEAARALAGFDPRRAVEVLPPLLAHALPELRLAAAEALGTIREEAAAAVLLQRLRSPEIARADRAEREALFVALGRQRTASGFGLLSEKLTNPGRSGILKARAIEDQLLAVRGLAAEGSERSLRLLEFSIHPDQENPGVVVTACKAAAHHVRDALARGGEKA